jgi:hypothetical protein
MEVEKLTYTPDFRNATPNQSINKAFQKFNADPDPFGTGFSVLLDRREFEGHFIHRLRQSSNASGTDRDVILEKTGNARKNAINNTKNLHESFMACSSRICLFDCPKQ